MKITSKNKSRLIWFTVGFFLMILIGISTFLIVKQEITRRGLLFLLSCALGLGLTWAWIGPKAGQFFKASMAERRARKQSF
ncbi:MAG: hypothetical protein OXH57_06245, partial [Ekhidna sp.]|nr:hypothetical protein [Ekhidna sp.]